MPETRRLPFWQRLYNRRKRIAKFLGIPLVSGFGLFLLLDFIFPFEIEKSYSPLVYAEDGTLLNGFLSEDDKWRMYTDLEEISPTLRKAIIQKEDRYFYYHFGINPVSVTRAFWNNLSSGRRTSGASTITMQVTRLLEPKARTYPNKFLEMFRAFQLEWHYSKDELLQLYLNLVPYGGNIEGVKSASWLYFQRMPEQLSLAQVVTLSIIPNRPTSWGLGKNTEALQEARNRWLKKLGEEGIFSESEVADALTEPLDARFVPVPDVAPHLSRRLVQNHPQKKHIRTTLSPETQDQTARLTKDFSRRVRRLGIYNAAVLVVDNQTGKVRAYVGSSDFEDELHAGQVDGIQAFRSPGSTLKPLLYGLAFDQGLLTPKMQLIDIAEDFDGYTPQNFNGKFNGKVSVETALAYSLNVPAVKVLDELGVRPMVERLKDARFKKVAEDEEKLGLSLALGGCGVSLEELVQLYRSIATNGEWKPLRWGDVQELDTTKSEQVLSPAAAFMLREILLEVERPDLPADYQRSRHVPKIAWKTGTSYGRHDAWSIGMSKNYTIGVWLGNFSGEASQYLTGAEVATPLLFKLFLSLDYDAEDFENLPPSEVRFRKVCSHTGKVPREFCTDLVEDMYVPKVSSVEVCDHLRYVWVSEDEKYSYCSACLPPNGNYQKRLFPNLPPELAAYYARKEIILDRTPPHSPTCPRVRQDENAPKITSPINGRTYIREDETTQLQLACQIAQDAQTVYWYINGEFYQKASATGAIFFTPKRGTIQISCSDERGRNADIEVKVE
ncbi:MAG: penicillin-binding protein 1C [Bacteroidota bacterium]